MPDIDEKDKLIAHLQSELDILTDVLHVLPGNVYWLDDKGFGKGCNNNNAKAFGLSSPAEFVGKHLLDYVDNAGAEKVQSNNLEVILSNHEKSVEEPVVDSQGRTSIYLSQKTPFYDRNGKLQGVLGVSFDITERKKMEENLQKAKQIAETANQLKAEFIHNMEHDIRTPFSGIYGIARMLAETETDAVKKDFLNDISNCAKELLEYSTGILDFSMIESGSIPVVSKKFSLKKLVDGLTAMETPPAKVKGIEFIARCENDVPSVVIGDRYRLQRILINLISNAIKFTNSGHVSLSIKKEKEIDNRNIILSFVIEDSGMGIPKEKQSVIFEKFTRLGPSNQRMHQGQGLGLRVVKQFMDEMDAEIDIKSVVNKGTTFVCTFPFKLPLIDNIMDDD